MEAKQEEETPSSIFCNACAEGDITKVQEQLSEDKSLLQCTDPSGYSPLHWAALYNKVEVVKYLLKEGADATNKGFHGDTPVHWATKQGSEKSLDILISHLLR